MSSKEKKSLEDTNHTVHLALYRQSAIQGGTWCPGRFLSFKLPVPAVVCSCIEPAADLLSCPPRLISPAYSEVILSLVGKQDFVGTCHSRIVLLHLGGMARNEAIFLWGRDYSAPMASDGAFLVEFSQ